MKISIERDEIEFLEGFYDEAMETLDGIEEKILSSEDIYEEEIVQELFRIIHSVKGLSSFFNLNHIKHLSHIIENLLDKKRKLKEKINSEEVDFLLKSSDILLKMIFDVDRAVKKANKNEDPVIIVLKDIDFSDLEEGITNSIQDEIEDIDSIDISFPEGMKEVFILETVDHIELIEEVFMKIERKPNSLGLLDEIFRSIHSIKGNAGLLISTIEDKRIRSKHLLNEVLKLSTSIESVIQIKRDNKQPLVNSDIDTLLYGIDSLKFIVNRFKQNDNTVMNTDVFVDKINDLSLVEDLAREDKDLDAGEVAFKETLDQLIESIGIGIDKIKGSDDYNTSLDSIERALKNLIKLFEGKNNSKLAKKVRQKIVVIEEVRRGNVSINNACHNFKELINELEKKDSKDQRDDIEKPQRSVSFTNQVIKVPQEKIDKLMNLIGELMIKKNNFNSLAKEILIEYGLAKVADKIKQAGNQVSRISEDLQDTIMAIRMVPLSIVFSRFPRLIRDLSKSLGKKINIDIQGEDTELDKTLVEVIGDPLVHIIRNSIDHGIESPQERMKKGKGETGNISIKGYNEGQFVIIEIKDDGKGIDPEKVAKKAIEKGIIEENNIEKMSKNELQMLVFAPGFSTKTEVSDLSGRGVGMDVVRTNIERISGSVSLESEIDMGTTIKMKLPLTLAVNKGIEARVDREYYYISVQHIIETVRVDRENIITHKNKQMIIVRDEILPLLSLSKILNKPDEYPEELEILVSYIKGRKFAIKVDKVIGESEYLIKPLPGLLSNISFYSGAVITGKGEIKLVIDPLRLIYS